jgi:hypothetical protein
MSAADAETAKVPAAKAAIRATELRRDMISSFSYSLSVHREDENHLRKMHIVTRFKSVRSLENMLPENHH